MIAIVFLILVLSAYAVQVKVLEVHKGSTTCSSANPVTTIVSIPGTCQSFGSLLPFSLQETCTASSVYASTNCRDNFIASFSVTSTCVASAPDSFIVKCVEKQNVVVVTFFSGSCANPSFQYAYPVVIGECQASANTDFGGEITAEFANNVQESWKIVKVGVQLKMDVFANFNCSGIARSGFENVTIGGTCKGSSSGEAGAVSVVNAGNPGQALRLSMIVALISVFSMFFFSF